MLPNPHPPYLLKNHSKRIKPLPKVSIFRIERPDFPVLALGREKTSDPMAVFFLGFPSAPQWMGPKKQLPRFVHKHGNPFPDSSPKLNSGSELEVHAHTHHLVHFHLLKPLENIKYFQTTRRENNTYSSANGSFPGIVLEIGVNLRSEWFLKRRMGKVDSPFFSAIVLFNNQPIPQDVWWFSGKKDPWKEWVSSP